MPSRIEGAWLGRNRNERDRYRQGLDRSVDRNWVDVVGVGDRAGPSRRFEPPILWHRDGQHHGLGQGYGLERPRRADHARIYFLAVLEPEARLTPTSLAPRGRVILNRCCLLYTSPSPRDRTR